MDETRQNESSTSRWFRFTIRELLLLMVIAGLSLGWWNEHRELAQIKETFRVMRSIGFDVNGFMKVHYEQAYGPNHPNPRKKAPWRDLPEDWGK